MTWIQDALKKAADDDLAEELRSRGYVVSEPIADYVELHVPDNYAAIPAQRPQSKGDNDE